MGTFHNDLLTKVAKYCAKSFHRNLLNDDQKLRSLLEFGITREVVDDFQVGYASSEWTYLTDRLMNDKRDYLVDCARTLGLVIEGERGLHDRFRDRYIFPIISEKGKHVGFSSVLSHCLSPEFTERPLDVVQLNSSHSPIFDKCEHLLGGTQARGAVEENKILIVADDPLDTLLFHSSRRTCVVSELVQGALGSAPSDSLAGELRDSAEKIYRLESQSQGLVQSEHE